MRAKVVAKGRIAGQVYRSKSEADYALILEAKRQAGEILWWQYEPITLKLAPKLSYTPDFFVMLPTGELIAIEVKGFPRDDAMAKLKIAAKLFPFRFLLVKANRKTFHEVFIE